MQIKNPMISVTLPSQQSEIENYCIQAYLSHIQHKSLEISYTSFLVTLCYLTLEFV
jgi:hypothetical protein